MKIPKNNTPRYVIISAAKDEATFIETTILSILRQTLLPTLWIVVDDGSQDETPCIVRKYAQEHSWIRLLSLERKGKREYGSPVIAAFLAGYPHAQEAGFEYIVKLDCDLDLPSEYFQKILKRFEVNSNLGIASGIYLEKEKNGKWTPVKLPNYHAAGACKVVRAQCYADIGGFVPVYGWDTIDQIRALIAGWQTCHFGDLEFLHLRREGSGVGLLRTNLRRGEGYYTTGGGPLFFVLKALHRMFAGRPFFLGGAIMMAGYLRASLQRRPRIVSPAEATYYRKLLNSRLVGGLKRLLRVRRSPRSGEKLESLQ